MTTPSRRIFSLSLALLLFLPALAIAGDGSIDLNLEHALALQGATFKLDEFAAEAADVAGRDGASLAGPPEAGLGQDGLARLQDSPRVQEVAAEQYLADRARDGSGGFGRWMKKYWYVPVLAAAAIVAVADDGSDGPEDEED